MSLIFVASLCSSYHLKHYSKINFHSKLLKSPPLTNQTVLGWFTFLVDNSMVRVFAHNSPNFVLKRHKCSTRKSKMWQKKTKLTHCCKLLRVVLLCSIKLRNQIKLLQFTSETWGFFTQNNGDFWSKESHHVVMN